MLETGRRLGEGGSKRMPKTPASVDQYVGAAGSPKNSSSVVYPPSW